MLPVETILAIAGGFLVILTLFVLFSTGSFFAVLVLWTMTALIIMVLVYYGFIDISKITSDLLPKKEEPKKDTPQPTEPTVGGPRVGSEVFHISQNQFTYDDAPAVCAAYGAQLASLEQIIDAYNHGAEWCGYGWSAGGMALYPTQKSTWTELQKEIDPAKRTACGRPGVNGGYFAPNTKFGVNCFGFKPAGKAEFPVPVPGTDPTAFASAVNSFKSMLKTFSVSPFSRIEWSGYDSTPQQQVANYGAQFTQSLGKLADTTKEDFSMADPAYIENTTNAAYTASPYGLRGTPGDKGDPGPAGPAGPIGPMGPEGKEGPRGLTGPMGPQGLKGDTGQQGAPGVKGDKGDKGDKGEGISWSTIPQTEKDKLKGSVGPKGDKGDKGDTGAQGPPGLKGDQGLPGTPGQKGDQGPMGPGGIASKLGPDNTLDSNNPPSYYYGKGPGIYFEPKSTGTKVGLDSWWGSGMLETSVPGSNRANGAVVQEYKSGIATAQRESNYASNGASWNPWRKIFG